MDDISALDIIGYALLAIFSIGLIAVIPLVAKSKGWLRGNGMSKKWRSSPATTAATATGSSAVPTAPAAPTPAAAASTSKDSKKSGWFSWSILLKIAGLILIILAGVWAYHEIASRKSGGPFCSSAARSGDAKGCYQTPRSSSAKLTTQKSVAEIESERGSFCFTGKKTPPWVQIPEGGYDLKYSTIPATAEPVTQCAYSPAKPGQSASGSKYSCDGSKHAYWFRAKAAKPDSGQVCVRYRFVLRT